MEQLGVRVVPIYDDRGTTSSQGNFRVVVSDPNASTGELHSVVSAFDILFTIISIGLFVLDEGSDIWLAHIYYTTGNPRWFMYTLTVVVVPTVIVNTLSLSWYISDYQHEQKRNEKKTSVLCWIVRAAFWLLHISRLLRYVTLQADQLADTLS